MFEGIKTVKEFSPMRAAEYRLTQPLTAVSVSDKDSNRLIIVPIGARVHVKGPASFSQLAGGIEIHVDNQRCYVFLQDLESRAEQVHRQWSTFTELPAVEGASVQLVQD